MQWENWEVTKAVLELGGVDPDAVMNATPAQRLALVGKIDWRNISLPRLKAALGPSFRVPADWKRQFGIEKLKKIKAAVDAGQTITDPKDQRLLGVWRTLEVQLGDQILPADPESHVGLTRLPMNPADRKRFYRTLTGTNEAVNPGRPLRLSAQSAYDYLTQRYNVEIINDEEAKDLYLTRILQDLKSGTAFVSSSQQGSEADAKTLAGLCGSKLGRLLGAGTIL